MASNNTITVHLGINGVGAVVSGLGRVSAAVSSTVRGISGISGGILGALGIAGTGAAIAAGIKDIADLGGALKSQAIATGISVSNLLKYKVALRDSGASAEATTAIIGRMSKALEESYLDAQKGFDNFGRYGLSLESLIQMDPASQFEAIYRAVAALPTPSQRAAAAMDLFGKAGAELIPFFSNGGALSDAERTLGRMPAILERNRDLLDNVSSSIGHIRIKVQQAFAGLADTLLPETEGIRRSFEELDLTGAGQAVGGYVLAAKKAWTDGKFSEFIALSLQAGFEGGAKGIEKTLDYINQLLGSAMIKGIVHGSITGFFLARAPVQAFEIVFTSALMRGFAKATNFFVDLLEKIPGFKSITLGQSIRVPVPYSVSLEKSGQLAFTKQLENARYANDYASKFMSGIPGLTPSLPAQFGSAFGELKKLVNAQIADNAAKGRSDQQLDTVVRSLPKIVNYLEIERDLKNALSQIDQFRAGIEKSFSITAAEKYKLTRKLYEDEKEWLTRSISLLQKRLELERDPRNQERISGMIDSLSDRRRSVDGSLGTMGADPSSFGEQMASAFTQIADRIGTLAQQIGNVFNDVVNTAIQSTGQYLDDLIWKTDNWRKGLMGVGVAILHSITRAITNMIAQWIAGMILQYTVGKMLEAAGLATAGALASSYSAIWATPATLQTIATEGAGAASAPALIGASIGSTQAVIQATQVQGFASGGRPDVGRTVLVGEMGPELVAFDSPGTVVPANVTADALRGGLSGESPMNIAIIMVADMEAAALKAIESSSRYDRVFVRKLRENRTSTIGVQS